MNLTAKVCYQIGEFIAVCLFIIMAFISYIIQVFHDRTRATEIARQLNEAASMSFNTSLTDYTISARTGRAWLDTPRPLWADVMHPFIDWLFLASKGEKNHCNNEWVKYQKKHNIKD
jgi:hypothetical protein